jgi:hypothetical protein
MVDPARTSPNDGEQSPDSGNALQLMFSSSNELETCTDHVISHSLAHQHLTRFGSVAHSLGDGDGQAGDVLASHLDLTRMNTGPQDRTPAQLLAQTAPEQSFPRF